MINECYHHYYKAVFNPITVCPNTANPKLQYSITQDICV